MSWTAAPDRMMFYRRFPRFHRNSLMVCMLAVLLWPLSRCAEADIYRYTDENGVIHFSNVGLPIAHNQSKVKAKAEATKGNTALTSTRKTAARAAEKQPSTETYADIIARACDRHGVDPALVQAIVKVESDFNPFALSQKGAMGLMQLMPQTAVDMNVRNTFNPHDNIDGGVKYLRYLIDRYAGNLSLALAAYNSGETAVKKWGTVPPFPETQSYVKKILGLYGNIDAAPTPAGYTIYMGYGQDGVLLLTDDPYKRGNDSVGSKKRRDL